MTHPLTDEMIDKMSFIDVWWSDEYGPNNENLEEYRLIKGMRSAYDKGGKDMLEQVIEWLREDDYYAGLRVRLMEAMRPPCEQKNPKVNDRRIRNNLIEIWTGFEWVVQAKAMRPQEES